MIRAFVLGLVAAAAVAFSAATTAADAACIGGNAATNYYADRTQAFNACYAAGIANNGTGCWNLTMGQLNGVPTSTQNFSGKCNGVNYSSNQSLSYRSFTWSASAPSGLPYQDPETSQWVATNPVPTCTLPEVLNELTNTCEVCASGSIVGGVCQTLLDNCATGMVNYDLANQAMTSCSTGVTCGSVTGASDYDPSFDFCQGYSDTCAASGGTYGAVNLSGTSQHVCISGGTMPSCADSAVIGMYPDGTQEYAVACTTQTTPDWICDGTRFDCDGDLQIDDQDSDGCLDNGGTNDALCVGSITGDSVYSPYSWDNPLTAATQGAGQCDPTSKNYSECIGQAGAVSLSVLEAKADTTNASLSAIEAALTTTGTFDGERSATEGATASTFKARFDAIPIVQAAAGLNLTGSAVCPSPTFDAFGTQFAINYHCTLYADISGIISALMLGLFSLMGFRHVMSA